MNIYPSILTYEIDLVRSQLKISSESGLIQTVQVDIIDGYFVDNITVTPESLVELEIEELEIDFHLMTQEPLDYVREIAGSKDMLPVRAVISQIEQMTNQQDYVDEVRRNNFQIGLSLNIHTPLSAIDEDILEQLDVLQLMSIPAGYQGQKFNVHVYDKLKELNELMEEQDLHFEVIIDGGVTEKNISKLYSHGATGFSIGSYLWNAPDFSEAVETLETSI